MANFVGEFDCKVDNKGRILLPAAFRKQIGEVKKYRFVIKNSPFEQCLELFPMEIWEKIIKDIEKDVEPFNPEHRYFLRNFRSVATEVECDSRGRIRFPIRLMNIAEITNKAILTGRFDMIEIWSPELFCKSYDDELSPFLCQGRAISKKDNKFKKTLSYFNINETN